MKKTKNKKYNFKRKLFRGFKKYEKETRNYEFEELLYRDQYVCDAKRAETNIVFSLKDFKVTRGVNRFYLMRYCYAEHINIIGDMDLKNIQYGEVFPLLNKRRQHIITVEQAKELLFPLAIHEPIKVGIWLKQYRKFYNKYVVLKRRIKSMIEV